MTRALSDQTVSSENDASETPARFLPACCFIIPPSVLRHYSRDESLDADTRTALQDSYLETERLRGLREAHRTATLQDPHRLAPDTTPHKAVLQVFDCGNRRALPGLVVPRPSGAYKTANATTAKVLEFYKKVLGRNSVDNKGFDLNSSLHYGKHYDNAFWNGRQMVYGDGDGKMFTGMYLSPDVIGHEITHGVTQYESALRYQGESGALNESLSDVFGVVFNQWLNNWDVTEPKGWLVGAGIIAQPSKDKGIICLRDMVTPGAAHCLSTQPDRYSQIDPTAEVHTNSGVPNKAFALFAKALGGQAWTQAIRVWYDTATNRQLRTDATFAEFAGLTVKSAKKLGGATLARQCKKAWDAVEVPAGSA